MKHLSPGVETLAHVAVVCDLVEENWPSMDLVGQMLVSSLVSEHSSEFHPLKVCPPMRRRASRVPKFGRNLLAHNADRLLNRFWDYPRWLRKIRERCDLFHVVDHSYSQLAHELPPERTVITCHDLDTFRCLVEPEREPRSVPFRAMTKRVLTGMQRAARVTCDSVATRDQVLTHRLIAPERLVVVPNGVHTSCSPLPNAVAEAEAARLLGEVDDGGIELLHVGSTIARKRIDVLLKVVAGVRKHFPNLRLIRVGGEFTPQQAGLVERLGLAEAMVVLPFLEREVLAAVYRRAAAVLVTSDAEGFGLPVVEAMACGTVVVASGIPALREVGGDAATYCPTGDVAAWNETLVEILLERRERPEEWQRRREHGLRHAEQYSWAAYARKMVEVYQSCLAAL
jgi:glycosyltransferase involved in cell wall biosynthesis